MMLPIVEAQDLEKYFHVERPLYRQFFIPFATRQKIWALKGVSFRINPREILGVVGPNGAGKTTLLRILADLLESTSGLVMLCGQSLNGKKCCLRGKIGYVPSDDRSFFWRLTGRQNLEFFASIYGVRRFDARRRIAAMLNAFALTQKANQLFRDYSTGTRKKFALIRALVHQPTIILLDELTNSLDLESAEAVKSMVRKCVSSRNDCAAVWSTHRLEEIAEVCDKVLILNQGEVKFFGPVSDVETKFVRNVYFNDKSLNAEAASSVNNVFL